MLILTFNKDIPLKGYYGTVGEETTMFDFSGNRLKVGDIVGIVHKSERGNLSNYQLGVVVHSKSDIVNYGEDEKFVLGLRDEFNETLFGELPEIDVEDMENEDDPRYQAFWEKVYELTEGWQILKVKGCEDLINGEKLMGDYSLFAVDVPEVVPYHDQAEPTELPFD